MIACLLRHICCSGRRWRHSSWSTASKSGHFGGSPLGFVYFGRFMLARRRLLRWMFCRRQKVERSFELKPPPSNTINDCVAEVNAESKVACCFGCGTLGDECPDNDSCQRIGKNNKQHQPTCCMRLLLYLDNALKLDEFLQWLRKFVAWTLRRADDDGEDGEDGRYPFLKRG